MLVRRETRRVSRHGDEPMSENDLFNRALPHDSRSALFGGKNAVRVWSLDSSPMPPFTALLACELEPDGSVGAHVQQEFPEVVIVIEGRGSATVSGRTVPLHSGVVVSLPQGQTLAIENASSSEPLRYLIVKARDV